MRERRREFREALLPATLRHANAKVVGYRELWGDRGATPISLSELPLTSKALFAAEPSRFLDNSVATASVQHTGGTTKLPLLMHRSGPELAYIREFFTAVIGDGTSPSQTPLCVSVLGNFHGDPTPMPYPGPTFQLDVNDGYWDLHKLFYEPSDFLGRHIRDTIIVGLESQLRVLTCKLRESNFDFAKSTVRSVHSTGDLITARLRQFYETTWRCPLTNRYSMSEIFGGAELCSRCGYFHCDTHLIGEVVDVNSGRPVESGYGVLVLTSLFPFVQKQPMIRYRTGDIVELGPRDCIVDELSFLLNGRETHAVIEDDGQGSKALLLGAKVYDVLDRMPEVAQSEFMEIFKSLKGVSSHVDLGHLKYKVDFDKSRFPFRLCLSVELRFTYYLYPEHTAKVLDQIRMEILCRHSYLAERVASGSVEFEVAAALPGHLKQIQVDETE
jgi:phenylacetate-coenzyme A ligase PaaK-like adenylate-forming protein